MLGIHSRQEMWWTHSTKISLHSFPAQKHSGDDDHDTVAEGNRCVTEGNFGNEKDVADRKSRAYAN